MDALDRLAPDGQELLSRVDDALRSRGAPADHPVWPLLRTVGALPGEVLAFAVGMRAAPLATAGHQLIRGYHEERAHLLEAPQWTGAAGDSFAARAAALAADLVTAADRLVETGSFAQAVAVWMDELRAGMARALAAALGSAQAVMVRSCTLEPAWEVSPQVASAAADIGVAVLRAAAGALEAGEQLVTQWSTRLAAPVPPPARADATPRAGGGGFTVEL